MQDGYTKTDHARAMNASIGSGIRDVSVTLGARIVVLIPSLAIQSCLAWFLEPAGRGTYAVCMMFAGILSVTCLFGLDAAAQYFIASRRFTVSEGVSALLALGGLGGILAVVLGLLAIRMPLEIFKDVPPGALCLAVFLAPLQLLSPSLLLMLAAVREFTYRAIITVLESVLRLTGILILVKALGLGLHGALGANMVGAVVSSAAILRFLRHHYQLQWTHPDRVRVRGMVAYGARYYLASLSNIVNAQIGVLVLVLFVSPSEIGLFAAGVALVMTVTMIPDAVACVIHARVASDPAGRPELTARCARTVAALCCAIVVLIAVLAEPLVSLLLSPKFLPAVPIIWLAAPGAVVRAIGKVIVPYLNGTNHPGVFSLSILCGLVTNFTLLIILLPRMGLNGAACAMTGGALVNATVLIAAFRMFSGLTFAQAWLPRPSNPAVISDAGHK